MKELFNKTVVGLERACYVRQLFFGSLFLALVSVAAQSLEHQFAGSSFG